MALLDPRGKVRAVKTLEKQGFRDDRQGEPRVPGPHEPLVVLAHPVSGIEGADSFEDLPAGVVASIDRRAGARLPRSGRSCRDFPE